MQTMFYTHPWLQRGEEVSIGLSIYNIGCLKRILIIFSKVFLFLYTLYKGEITGPRRFNE